MDVTATKEPVAHETTDNEWGKKKMLVKGSIEVTVSQEQRRENEIRYW